MQRRRQLGTRRLIFASLPLIHGVNPGLCFTVPTNAVLGTNFARFRLSSTGGLTPLGAAQDGEVEDYLVMIRQRAPTTNPVITWITVTNLWTTNQVATVYWTAETNVHHQLLTTWTMGTNLGYDLTWTNAGPVVIGPARSQAHTNPVTETQRYYRVWVPYPWP